MRTYEERVNEASKEQGIDGLVIELAKLGISATSEQTGGFTMCAYIPLKNDRYIYANTYGASLYFEDDYLEDIVQNESEGNPLLRSVSVAHSVAQWIKENNY